MKKPWTFKPRQGVKYRVKFTKPVRTRPGIPAIQVFTGTFLADDGTNLKFDLSPHKNLSITKSNVFEAWEMPWSTEHKAPQYCS